MSFTARDLFYVIIISLLVFISGKVIDSNKLKYEAQIAELKLESEKRSIELTKTIQDQISKSDSLDLVITKLNLRRDELNLQNKKLKIEIKFIQNEYEKKLLFIDTASLKQVVEYWTIELDRRQHENKDILLPGD